MTQETNGSILSIRELNIAFRHEKQWNSVVRSLNLDLKKGETLGIVGESGSGKSVTCLALMGLLPRTGCQITGSISYQFADPKAPAGQLTELLGLPEKQKQAYRGNEIAMIFQEPMTSLNPVFSCGEQVAEAIRIHRGSSKRQARELSLDLFQEVQLPEPARIYDAYPHQLSGGQKQRVMIAMALSCNPQILVADEPTTALDVTVQHAILELLHRIQTERGMSMLFISHDLGIVSEIASKVLVMLRGDVVESGTVEEVFMHPAHPYTRGLLACRPSKNLNLKRLPVISDFMETDAQGRQIEKQTRVGDLEKALSWAPGEKELRRAQAQSGEIILHVSGLSKSFFKGSSLFAGKGSKTVALDSVSLQLRRGETLGLVGESGSGKTTLGRAILRLVEPDAGTIQFLGSNIRTLHTRELREMRKKMQIIFQDPYSSLNPRQTVGATIEEPMKVHHLHGSDAARRRRVHELLERVNLPSAFYDRYPHEFSGGQRQRIGIARALALEPEFIICDESVSALDVSVQAQIINLLISLREEFRLSYIFISHDLSVVQFISDRILVLNKGRMEEEGSSEQIYNAPVSEYTRRLISSIPRGKGI